MCRQKFADQGGDFIGGFLVRQMAIARNIDPLRVGQDGCGAR